MQTEWSFIEIWRSRYPLYYSLTLHPTFNHQYMRILLSLFFIFLSSLGYSNIGLDVSLISKERGNNRIYISNLSRSFCNFLCGPDAYINSEYQQIQQLIELDLSLFRTSQKTWNLIFANLNINWFWQRITITMKKFKAFSWKSSKQKKNGKRIITPLTKGG